MNRITVKEIKQVIRHQKIVYIDLDLSDESEKLVFVNGELPEYQDYRVFDITSRIEVEYNYGKPYIEIMITK